MTNPMGYPIALPMANPLGGRMAKRWLCDSRDRDRYLLKYLPTSSKCPSSFKQAAAFAPLSCLRNRLTHNSLPRTNQPKSSDQPQTVRAVQAASRQVPRLTDQEIPNRMPDPTAAWIIALSAIGCVAWLIAEVLARHRRRARQGPRGGSLPRPVVQDRQVWALVSEVDGRDQDALPIGDGFQHQLGIDCPCGPKVEGYPCEEGHVHPTYIHHRGGPTP